MHIRRIVPVALAAVFATACIDDPTAVEEEGAPPLSQEEIEFLGLAALLHGLEAQENVEDSTAVDVGAGRVTMPFASGVAALAPVSVDRAISTVVSCEGTGEVRVVAGLSGFFDDETGAADLVFTLVMTPDLCGESSDGFEATLYGDPTLTMVLELLTEGDGVVDIEGSLRGGLGALVDGRVAECAIDLAFSGTESAEGGTTLSAEGQVCGRPVSTTLGAGAT
ncbi:MAG: hypothetical protein P8188_03895 [Gemmatimonadota bacterium]